jgi:hypothetical protein
MLQAAVRAAVDGETDFSAEFRVIRPDGGEG